jgi:hypothetical protein
MSKTTEASYGNVLNLVLIEISISVLVVNTYTY